MAQDWYTRLIGATQMSGSVFLSVTDFLDKLELQRDPALRGRFRTPPLTRVPTEEEYRRARGFVPVRERRHGFSFNREVEPVKPIRGFVARPILPPKDMPRIPARNPRPRLTRELPPPPPRVTLELPEVKNEKEREYREERKRADLERAERLAREGEAERARNAEIERTDKEAHEAQREHGPYKKMGPPIRKPKPDPRYPQKPEKNL